MARHLTMRRRHQTRLEPKFGRSARKIRTLVGPRRAILRWQTIYRPTASETSRNGADQAKSSRSAAPAASAINRRTRIVATYNLVTKTAAATASASLSRRGRPARLNPQGGRCTERRALGVKPASSRLGARPGSALFERLPRGVRLTAAGEVFLAYARQAISELKAV